MDENGGEQGLPPNTHLRELIVSAVREILQLGSNEMVIIRILKDNDEIRKDTSKIPFISFEANGKLQQAAFFDLRFPGTPVQKNRFKLTLDCLCRFQVSVTDWIMQKHQPFFNSISLLLAFSYLSSLARNGK